MGDVYRARDERLKRDVAIKVVVASRAHDPALVRRLEQEAQTLGASITVLRLANHSGTEEEEYFADGMTDALITGLSKIGGFRRVITRTSASQPPAPRPQPPSWI